MDRFRSMYNDVPETYFTVWNNVFRIGNLVKNETILIHGGSSGIGTTAIQIAKEFGAHVITTTSEKEKVEKCYELGADGPTITKRSWISILPPSPVVISPN